MSRARVQHTDLRVAVTTTTMESSVCEPRAAASEGRPSASSCLDRLDDFVSPSGTDARWLCTDRCSYTTQELGLEAARMAMRRAGAQDDDASGLFRYEFDAEVVVLTDGVDCSLGEDGGNAFDPLGLRALWSDPGAAEASEAVCWNAGVACEGDPLEFDNCDPVDRGLDGVALADEDEPASVLWPLSRYNDNLVSWHVIGGVPAGEPREPRYSAAGDQAWLVEHGIDPGCSDEEVAALPPVRLRDIASELSSACDADYVQSLGSPLTEYSYCVLACHAAVLSIEYEAPHEEAGPIQACEGSYPELSVPTDAPACYFMREDSEAHCPAADQLELVLISRDPGRSGVFLLSPNLRAPDVEIPGCVYET